MSHTTPPLTPMSLGRLLGRIEHEWSTRHKVFDLPNARIWQPDPDIDLSFEFLGRRCATPVGPAAGPHSQMAQNIVLAWLGGARLFELKTVQVLDDLEIGRPCIDMETIGFNIEWSQELEVAASLEEYVKAWMLIELLRHWDPLAEHLGPDPGSHVFDMSVGYDLAGIRDPKVAGFIDGMRDATDEIERLRPEIGGGFAPLRDLEFPSRVADTITLSTFHGCPPDEIESITKHLIEHHDVDVIVKLNPTLLGYEAVRGMVVDELGYTDLQLDPAAFDADLQFDRGVELIGELDDFARARGHRFGIKLTNTLVVRNHKGWMPDDTMYLSGPPLHVLASNLLARLADALPARLALPGHDGSVMVSFSAGVDKANLPNILGTGVGPATVCSDLLKPGGYGRLAPMLKHLTGVLRDSDVTDLAGWRTHRLAVARDAGHPDPAHHHAAEIRDDGIGPYHHDGNTKLPRADDHELEMFGCVACNFCITVCPNDAFFSIPSLDGMDGRQQYLVLAELCNECGNCLTFCPEDGDPAEVKPRIHVDPGVFDGRTGQGFLLTGDPDEPLRSRLDDAASLSLVAQLLDAGEATPLGAGDATS